MAFICTKPKDSCRNCEHYRYDEDYGGKACFAAQDEKEHKCPLGGNTENDCTDCAYAGDYHYDPVSGKCVCRKD